MRAYFHRSGGAVRVCGQILSRLSSLTLAPLTSVCDRLHYKNSVSERVALCVNTCMYATARTFFIFYSSFLTLYHFELHDDDATRVCDG